MMRLAYISVENLIGFTGGFNRKACQVMRQIFLLFNFLVALLGMKRRCSSDTLENDRPTKIHAALHDFAVLDHTKKRDHRIAFLHTDGQESKKRKKMQTRTYQQAVFLPKDETDADLSSLIDTMEKVQIGESVKLAECYKLWAHLGHFKLSDELEQLVSYLISAFQAHNVDSLFHQFSVACPEAFKMAIKQIIVDQEQSFSWKSFVLRELFESYQGARVDKSIFEMLFQHKLLDEQMIDLVTERLSFKLSMHDLVFLMRDGLTDEQLLSLIDHSENLQRGILCMALGQQRSATVIYRILEVVSTVEARDVQLAIELGYSSEIIQKIMAKL